MKHNNEKLISICILSYNRPQNLLRLLETIDTDFKERYEVIISDDFSPKQNKIEENINLFTQRTGIPVLFIKNNINRGYDKNFNILVNKAKGKWLVFMGV